MPGPLSLDREYPAFAPVLLRRAYGDSLRAMAEGVRDRDSGRACVIMPRIGEHCRKPVLDESRLLIPIVAEIRFHVGDDAVHRAVRCFDEACSGSSNWVYWNTGVDQLPIRRRGADVAEVLLKSARRLFRRHVADAIMSENDFTVRTGSRRSCASARVKTSSDSCCSGCETPASAAGGSSSSSPISSDVLERYRGRIGERLQHLALLFGRSRFVAQ